jgi:hypothetical protein
VDALGALPAAARRLRHARGRSGFRRRRAALRESLPLVQAHPEWRGLIGDSELRHTIGQ